MNDHGLEAYTRLYHDAVISIYGSRVVSLGAGEALSDFPERLPEPARRVYRAEQEFVRRVITGEPNKDYSDPAVSAELGPLTERLRAFAGNATMLISTRLFAGAKDTTPDFSRLISSQELALTIAHLEAFLCDSVRAICRAEPAVLRRRKQLTWEDVLAAGDWERLTDMLIELCAYDFGWRTLREKVRTLTSEFGLTLSVPEDGLVLLSDAEQRRHAVMHNGGRASAEFLRKSNHESLSLNEQIPIEEAFLSRVNVEAGALCSEVFVALSEKHFGIPRAANSGVFWLKATQPDGGTRAAKPRGA